MIKEDDRTDDEKQTHHILITALDKVMSWWGGAAGGQSRCAWACTPEQSGRVYAWVHGRSDMTYVNRHNEKIKKYYPPAGTAHFHIYVVDDNHPALN